MMNFEMKGRKGQIGFYVIIALAVVGAILIFYTFRASLFGPSIPTELASAFDYYKLCVEQEAKAAIGLAEAQGGHVNPGIYIPGSEYAPFSSQLNFLGFPVPYWFYVTGNGLIKENVPTKSGMQDEIAQYIEENVNLRCNFDAFYEKGFDVTLGTPTADVTISDTSVAVSVSSNMVVTKGESSATMSEHETTLQTSLGKLYDSAVEIYGNQRTSAFLENYSLDTLVLYAPVDGAELSCSGKIWKTREVVDSLKSGLEANIASLKLSGDYYTLSNPSDKYFVVDVPVDEQVNFVYSKSWPTKVEIFGADDELMVAEPVGTQPGMGMMGFCYAPYHFVYDVTYPVMIQVLEGQEIFQFPVVVIIDNNVPRKADLSQLSMSEEEVDICQLDNKDVEVNVYDSQLNKIDANISYICFNQRCNLGSTVGGTFIGKAPACGNGYLRATATGYAEKRQLFSTNEESATDVILTREYEVGVSVEVGGNKLDGTAMVAFEGEENSVSTLLPEFPTVKLSEGLYNVTVYVYSNSSITMPASTKTQCADVPRGGLLGLFGATKQKCIDITIPETKIDSALAGGGRSEIYILQSDLQKGRLKLRVDALPKPDSIEELQINYAAFEAMHVSLALE